MAEMDLNQAYRKVAYLMDAAPQARQDNLLIILMYWQIFDGIELPSEIVAQILEKATAPETITRSRRKVTAHNRYKQLLELQRMNGNQE